MPSTRVNDLVEVVALAPTDVIAVLINPDAIPTEARVQVGNLVRGMVSSGSAAIGYDPTTGQITIAPGYDLPTLDSMAQWDAAYGWGNHADAGYLTAESDPVFAASAAAGIDTADVLAWDAAYGWGNHASAGYLTAESDPVYLAQCAARLDPTGFPNRTATSAPTFDAGSLTLTLAKTGASFDFYSAGTKYTKSANQTKAIANVVGLHYLYFDTSGVLQETSAGPWDISSANVPVATVYWNGTAGWVGDERHGCQMDGQTHETLHEALRSLYVTGGTATIAADLTTHTVTGGEWYDEDFEHTPGDRTSTPIFYRSGSTWLWTAAQAPLYTTTGTPAGPAYDAAGTLTKVGVSKFTHTWLFWTNNPTYPLIAIAGQAQYNTRATAEAAGPETLSLGSMPSAEMLLLYRIVWKENGGAAEAISTTDYRSGRVGAVANYVATDHTALANLAWASSGHSGTAGQVAGWNDTTGAPEPLAVLGIPQLVGPDTDAIIFWDDDQGRAAFLTVGNSVAITDTTLDTIQDIRTSAIPTFGGLVTTRTATDTSGNVYGANVALTVNPAGASSGVFRGGTLLVASSAACAQNITTLNAMYFQATHAGSGTVTSTVGAYIVATNSGAGSTTLSALRPYVENTGGVTIANAYAIYIANAQVSGAGSAITNNYALYIAAQTGGTTNYAIMAAAGNAVFNENGTVDSDFRIESDANANMLFVDAGNDCVCIGTSAVADSAMFYVAGKISCLNECEVNGDFNHDGTYFGVFGAPPAAQGAAYTQTYSTAARTNPNATAATLTDNTGGSADTTLAAVEASYTQATIRNNFADLAAMVNKLTADHLATKKLLNALIDDLQSFGFCT